MYAPARQTIIQTNLRCCQLLLRRSRRLRRGPGRGSVDGDFIVRPARVDLDLCLAVQVDVNQIVGSQAMKGTHRCRSKILRFRFVGLLDRLDASLRGRYEVIQIRQRLQQPHPQCPLPHPAYHSIERTYQGPRKRHVRQQSTWWEDESSSEGTFRSEGTGRGSDSRAV